MLGFALGELGGGGDDVYWAALECVDGGQHGNGNGFAFSGVDLQQAAFFRLGVEEAEQGEDLYGTG